jgi:hypothetical protein
MFWWADFLTFCKEVLFSVVSKDVNCLFEEVATYCNLTKELTNVYVLVQSLAQNIFRLTDFSDDLYYCIYLHTST